MTVASAYLVETIPQDLELLAGADTRYTGRVLLRLVDGAREKIDVNAMNWSLLHNRDAPDEAGLSADALAALGGAVGRQLYDSLVVADRWSARLPRLGQYGLARTRPGKGAGRCGRG